MRRKVNVGDAFDPEATTSSKPGEDIAKRSGRKFKPAVGNDWDIEAKAVRRYIDLIDSLTRMGLVVIVCLAGLLGLAVAAVIGLQKGSSAPISAVWAVLGPIYGGISVYYFAPKRRR